MKSRTLLLTTTLLLIAGSFHAQTATTKARSVADSLATVRLVNAAGASKSIEVIGTLETGRLAGALVASKASNLTISPSAASRLASFVGAAKANVGQTMTPGQTIFVGQTGGTTTRPIASTGIGTAAATASDTIVVTARSSSPATPDANPLAASIERQVFPGDLARMGPTGLTVGANTEINGAFVIGPNGFPIPVTETPQSGTLAIGPNGFPLLTDAGPTAIGPNGFPETAPFTQTGLTRAGTPRDTALPAASSTGSGAEGFGSPAAATPAATGVSGPGIAAPSAGATTTSAAPGTSGSR